MFKQRKLQSLLVVSTLFFATAVLVNHNWTVPADAAAGMAAVIVELRDDPAAVYKARTEKAGGKVSQDQLQAYRDGLRAKQDQFLAALGSRGVSYIVTSRDIKNYDGTLAASVPLRYTLVYDGVALKVSPSAIPTIKSMAQVKGVYPDSKLRPMLSKSVPYIHAPDVYGNYPELTPFDSLNEGYEGQGMYVSIIDSGVDWSHPMFGGDATPPRLGVAPPTPSLISTNKKVVYYLPLADSVVADGLGHGTHVASTIAGYLAQAPGPDRIPNTADDIKLHGVAPQAKLMSYKVCSDVGSDIYELSGVPVLGCDSSNTIMALEDSVSPFTLTGQPKPIANAINMSLGGAGAPDTPSAVAASNAALTGCVVVAASGNSGPAEGTTGAPAAGTHVISVGATAHPGSVYIWSVDLLQASAVPTATLGAVTPANNLPADSSYNRVRIDPMGATTNLPAGSLAQHYVFIDNPLGPWPAAASGRIAFVNNALFVTYMDLATQASASGAVGLILVSDSGAYSIKAPIPSALISTAQAQVLIKAISPTDNDNPANGAISALPIRMNPYFTSTFTGDMAEFSSRGPVQGLGQVKPDISAPGITVLAATSPGSLLSVLSTVSYLPGGPGTLTTGDSTNAPNYIAIDGTSMASPHMAGAVTLVKQAHPDWSPDMIRTAFINTATNMRGAGDVPKADGETADSIIAQGGGLINVAAALNTKALMGVTGDGIDQPGILGSHSYGEVPVLNSRTTHTETVPVTVRDLSGQGGTFNLRVANNRELQRDGVDVSLSNSSVSVPANGIVTYNVNAAINGNVITQTSPSIEFQWYVIAERADGGQTLRMPFYLNASRSLPAQPRTNVETIADVMLGADGGTQLVGGFSYNDYPMNLGDEVLTLEGNLEFLEVADSGVNDLDFYLYGPDDPNFAHPIATSGVPGGPEHIKVTITKGGLYTWRVVGYANAPATSYTLTTTKTLGSKEPTAQAIAGDFVNAQGKPVDFDGFFTISWQGNGGETGFEVERSGDGVNYNITATLPPDQTSLTFGRQADGEIRFRIRGLTPGVIGSYETIPSNLISVIVDHRGKVDITSSVSTAMSNVSLNAGVFTLDYNLTNNSSSAYVPLVELNVIKITSTSGTVSVKNADNGGDGRSTTTAALFSYSDKLGSDQIFSPAETTGNRTMQFNDSAAELFSFDVNVTAYISFSGGGGGSTAPAGGSSGSGSSSSSGSLLLPVSRTMRVTVNPLTGTVTSKLL